MHTPVMLKETIKFLDIKQDGLYIDFTYGTGGHSKEILKYINKYGNLISIDKDELLNLITKDNIFKMSFDKFKKKSFFLKNIDGVILDLGISLEQIKDTRMGLSFNKNTSLDMRINSKQNVKADYWINYANKSDLYNFLSLFIKKKASKVITNAITKHRKKNKIRTSEDLCNIILKFCNKQKKNSINKIFTLVKILINNELFYLSILLKNINSIIRSNGVLILISFNSLEDNIIKNHFFSKNAVYKYIYTLNRPQAIEINKNYSSRSAIMRIFKKN